MMNSKLKFNLTAVKFNENYVNIILMYIISFWVADHESEVKSKCLHYNSCLMSQKCRKKRFSRF